MTEKPSTQGNQANHHGERQPDPVNLRRKQNATAEAERRDDHQPEQAMHEAKAREEYAGAIEPVANREEGAAHGL